MTDNRDVVRRFHETAWSEGDLDAAAALLADDLVDHDPLEFPGRAPGAAGIVQVIAMVRSALPDLVRTIEDQVAEGDLVATRFVDRGTHLGNLLGVEATGRVVEVRGINIERVQDGRICEIWHVEDMAGLTAQLAEGGTQAAAG